LGDIVLKDDGEEVLDLLIEIIGGVDLPIMDNRSSDPFVVVKFNRRIIHQTSYIPKNLNPIWTLKTKAFFLFQVKAKELFQDIDGLCFEVIDYDAYSANDLMGAVKVSPRFLYKATEERREFRLQPLMSKGIIVNHKVKGKLALRCRRATPYDKEFLKQYKIDAVKEARKDPIKLRGVAMIVKNVGTGGGGYVKTVVEKKRKKETIGTETVVKYKIRPEPDPQRKTQTTWMTKEEIDKESFNESRVWLDAGSGMLAKVFLEIINCKGIPNLDVNVGLDRNKTDAFCKIVYEDCICSTDVIDDCLSPRWMPWTNRAFVLHMTHTSSPLFIGVFDYDSSLHTNVESHDPIGRVNVDLTKLRADTEYLLTYQLYKEGTKISDRKPVNGTITIRLRLEVPDERHLVLSCLQPPPTIYVNDSQKRDFLCVKYTCKGYDNERFDTNVILSYIEELLAYMNLVVYLKDALINLLLWRGNHRVDVRIPVKPSEQNADGADALNDMTMKERLSYLVERYTKKTTILLPIHSMTLFFSAVTLVEKPSLLPSYIFGSIAWLLIAVMGFRHNNPDPWDQPKTFRDIVEILLVGEPLEPPPTITKNQNKKEASAYRKKWADKIKELEKNSVEEKRRAVREAREEAEIDSAEVDLGTESKGGLNLNPLKPFLLPVQKNLGKLLECVRFMKNVMLWEECYFAFWITCACIILGVFSLFIPWTFIVIWSTRLAVWAGCGPWMKLVDIYYYSKIEDLSKSKKSKRMRDLKKSRDNYLNLLKEDVRLKEEEAKKLKAMKAYMFGKYSTHVPVVKTDRNRDVPLHESSAAPYVEKPLSMARAAIEEAGLHNKRERGQKLSGVMIPKHTDSIRSTVMLGKAISNTRKLERGALASSLLNFGGDTNASAYSKIAQIILVAIVASFVGVPMISSAVQWAVKKSFPVIISSIQLAVEEWYPAISSTVQSAVEKSLSLFKSEW